jgi:hypothetical protein
MNKSTRNLLIIFLILAVIVYFFFTRKDTINTQNVNEKLFTADSSKIDKIEIKKTGETIVLEKVNGQWTMSQPVSYPADTNAITPILANLAHFKISSIASENPEKFSIYLDSANHTLVSTYQDGKLLGTFEIGKSAASYQNSYVKKPDENKIYIAENLSNANFLKAAKDFRSKLIFSIPATSITKIDFKSTDSNKVDFSCVKDSNDRWFIGPDSIAKTTMDGFLNLLNAYNTDDFKDSTITSFPAPTYTINIQGAQPTTIYFYKQNISPVEYIVQVSNKTQLFKFSEPFAGNSLKKKKDFIPEKTPEKTPDKTTVKNTDTKDTKKKK